LEETKPFVASSNTPAPPAILGNGETKKEEKISTNVDNEVVPTLSKIYPNVENRDRSLTQGSAKALANRDIKVGLDNNKVDALKDDQVEADNNRTIIYLLSCFNCFNR
jgi:hypothetical protein